MLKFFTNDLRRNVIKTLCLTLGMAVGFLLIAKVYFEGTSNTNFPDADRLYYITESVVQNGEYKEYTQTAGAIAQGMKRYIPQVEEATASTYCFDGVMIETENKDRLWVEDIVLVDSCWFSVLKTPVLSGNPRRDLQVRNNVFIPRSMARKLGDNPEGKSFFLPDVNPEILFNIAGVYEDYPANSTIPNAIYLSMPSMGQFFWDGTDNWIGNDRYLGYVLLANGTTPDDIKAPIDGMLRENIDASAFDIFHYSVGLKPLRDRHTVRDGVRMMMLILSVLAVVILMCAGLNFLLVTIGQMGKRQREMAVRKCYGTSNTAIFGRIMGESLFFILLSLGLGLLIAFSFAGTCRELLGNTPAELFGTGRVWIVEAAVCLVLWLVTGAIPAWMYCRTPVSHAIRASANSGRVWKTALLALQFAATGMLVCLLSLVVRQQSASANTDLGIDGNNLGYANIWSLSDTEKQEVLAQLRTLPGVENAASTFTDVLWGHNGNNVWVNDKIEDEINVADMYWANPEFIETLGMRLIQGGGFTESTDTTVLEAVVDSRFINVLKRVSGIEEENIIGRKFKITEHSRTGQEEFTVVGVVDELIRGDATKENSDTRAAVFFPSDGPLNHLYIRFTSLTPETLAAAQAVMDAHSQSGVYIVPFSKYTERYTEPIRKFGTAVVLVSLVVIFIALVGLIGYSTDEVQRRAKEIAIRKINGTTSQSIIRMFVRSTLTVALPSFIAGGVLAVIVGRHWLMQFTTQTSLGIGWMALCLMLLAVIVTAVTVFTSRSIANSNPVTHLRSE